MILWKLASIVCANPGLFDDKWSYDEVVNQLLYRQDETHDPIRILPDPNS